MPTYEQKLNNQRWILVFLGMFFLLCLIGQCTLIPVVLNENNKANLFANASTSVDVMKNFHIVVVTFSMVSFLAGVISCAVMYKNTYADFYF